MDMRHHHALLAYISDAMTWSCALLPHVGDFDEAHATTHAASLNHSIWFHNADFNCTEWILLQYTGDTIGM